MATERIEIVVTERGTREVKRSLEQVGKGATTTSSGVDMLKRALLALGGAALIAGIIRLGDSFTNLQNRLKTVTNGAAQLQAVTEDLLAIANATRQGFEATTEVYVRTANAVKELGISQREALDFTKALNQAVVLSGASATEANAALIQLAQGLASGALRGDELRSVLEQLPTVADVIAKSLGVTRGKLREMGQDGKITADIIIKAFAQARGELEEKFAKTVPTIGQAFTILRNNVTLMLGSFLKTSGVLDAVAKSIIFISEHLETLGRVVGALAITVGVTFGTVAIGKAVVGIKALTAAIAANPIGAIATAITAAVAALVLFSDKITIAKGEVTTLQDVAVAAFQIIKENVDAFISTFGDSFSGISDVIKGVFGDVDLSIKGILKGGAIVIDSFVGLWVGLANAIVAAFESLPAAIKNIFLKALRGAVEIVQMAVNKIIEILNKLPKVNIKPVNLENIVGDADYAGRSLGESVGEAFVTGFESSTSAQDLLGDVLTRADTVAKDRIAREQAAKTAAAAGRAGLGEVGPNKVAEMNAATEAQRRQNEQLELKKKLLIEIKGPQQEFADAQVQMKALLDEGQISIHEYNRALAALKTQALETGVTAADGFRRGFQRIKADIMDVSRAAENVLVNAFNNAEDALVEFVQTGKFNFKGFVDGILADVTRLLARQAITGLLNAFSGSAGGGAGGLLGGLLSGLGGAKQAGGPVSTGRSFLVGERGPELFTPTESGNVTSSEALKNMAASPEVKVQVINVQNPDDVPQAMASQQGDKVIVNSITRNRQTIKNALGVA